MYYCFTIANAVHNIPRVRYLSKAAGVTSIHVTCDMIIYPMKLRINRSAQQWRSAKRTLHHRHITKSYMPVSTLFPNLLKALSAHNTFMRTIHGLIRPVLNTMVAHKPQLPSSFIDLWHVAYVMHTYPTRAGIWLSAVFTAWLSLRFFDIYYNIALPRRFLYEDFDYLRIRWPSCLLL
uniref:Uncharacterized protein n=1 Tax=Riboviria sp. TaxID=2585031 RepID=A0A514D3W8_9VIRU|nr:MAG: hypothetical protein H2Rhizo33128_000005 [Riboviria sp.]